MPPERLPASFALGHRAWAAGTGPRRSTSWASRPEVDALVADGADASRVLPSRVREPEARTGIGGVIGSAFQGSRNALVGLAAMHE